MRHTWGLRCPIDPAHGVLLDWPTDRWGFMCPHRDHGGNGRFFTTAEAEAPTRAHEQASSREPTPAPLPGVAPG